MTRRFDWSNEHDKANKALKALFANSVYVHIILKDYENIKEEPIKDTGTKGWGYYPLEVFLKYNPQYQMPFINKLGLYINYYQDETLHFYDSNKKKDENLTKKYLKILTWMGTYCSESLDVVVKISNNKYLSIDAFVMNKETFHSNFKNDQHYDQTQKVQNDIGINIDKKFWIGSNAYKNINELENDLKNKNSNLNDLVKKLYYNNPSSSFSPRNYWEDVSMPHRLFYKETSLRLGDIVFNIPPTAISYVAASNVKRQTGIRQNSSVKEQSGYSKNLLRLSLWFNSLEDINGYEIESPFNNDIFNGTYYVDGLRSLIAQFLKAPFVPITNEYVNNKLGIFNVALESLNISTVPDFPFCIQAEILFKEFNIEPYIEDHPIAFEQMIDWDLFRWHYQKPLFKKSNSLKYLKPMTNEYGKDDIKFKILKEETIGTACKAGESLDIFYTYNLINENKTEYDLNQLNVNIDSISVSMNNLLPSIQMSNYAIPTTQYLGSGDILINLNMTTTDEKDIIMLNLMKQKNDELTRQYRDKNVIGFLKVENELINMTGTKYVLLDTLQIDTVAGFPGVYSIYMQLISFDPAQKEKENLYGFNPFPAASDTEKQIISQTSSGIKKRYIQDNYVFEKMQYINLFPDLELPTYQEANKVLNEINKFRDYKGIKGGINLFASDNMNGYVDPDFYVMYKDFDLEKNIDKILDTETKNKIYQLLKLEPEGGKVEKTIINSSEKDKEEMKNQKTKDIVYKKICSELIGEEIITTHPLNSDSNTTISFVQDYTAERMCYDMIKYGKKGRLVRAFPTYLIAFIDEGCGWLDGRRLWNNYYITHSALSIDIQKSRSTPNNTAMISLSNNFNIINDDDWDNQLKKRNKRKYDFGSPNLDLNMIRNHEQILKTIDIKAGVRLHIKMGYGNNTNLLPTVFNGVITNVRHNKVSHIIAQSDGIELINSVMDASSKDETNRMRKYGTEPSNIVSSIFTAKQGSVRNALNKAWGEDSRFGIDHFGINASSPWALFNLPKNIVNGKIKESFDLIKSMDHWKKYDMVKNIYLANLKVINTITSEEGIEAETNEIKDKKRIFDGEKNLRTYLYNRTPWDIFQTVTASVQDFICHPIEHNFQSTLFFGHPLWNVRYKTSYGFAEGPISYAFSINRRKSNPYIYSYNSYFTKSKPYLSDYMNSKNVLLYEHNKPFAQFHLITSGSSIIDNRIETSADNIKATNCTPSRTIDNTVSTQETVYADKSIQQSFQKTKVTDTTTVYSGYMTFWKAEKLINGFVNIFGESETNEIARNIAVSYLQQSFKRMYQGDLVLLGTPEIKPHDVIYINDQFADISGIAEVREINITMNTNGFITSLTPDLCTFTSESDYVKYPTYMKLTSIGSLFSCIEESKANFFYLDSIDKMLEAVLDKEQKYNIANGIKTALVPFEMIEFAILLRHARTGLTAARAIGLMSKTWINVKAFSKGVYLTVTAIRSKNFMTAFKTIKQGFHVASEVSAPSILGPLIIEGVLLCISAGLNKYIKYQKNKNVIKIWPLFYKSQPFVAGIDGHKVLIPGFEDENYILEQQSKEISEAYEMPFYKEVDDPVYQMMNDHINNKANIDIYLETMRRGVYGYKGDKFSIIEENPAYANLKEPNKDRRSNHFRRDLQVCKPTLEDDYEILSIENENGTREHNYISTNTDMGEPIYSMMPGVIVRVGLGINENKFLNPETIGDIDLDFYAEIPSIDYHKQTFDEWWQAFTNNKQVRDAMGWVEDFNMFAKNNVVIMHYDKDTKNTFYSIYMNLLTIEVSLFDWVKDGQLIGTSGVLIPNKYKPISLSESFNSWKKASRRLSLSDITKADSNKYNKGKKYALSSTLIMIAKDGKYINPKDVFDGKIFKRLMTEQDYKNNLKLSEQEIENHKKQLMNSEKINSYTFDPEYDYNRFYCPVDTNKAIITQGYHSAHHAIDIASNQEFIPLYSVGNGEVVLVSNQEDDEFSCKDTRTSRSLGKHVKIKVTIAETIYYVTYGHMSTIEVKIGDHVNPGQHIGNMGNSGHCCTSRGCSSGYRNVTLEEKQNGSKIGTHVHFILRDSNSNYLNPANYINVLHSINDPSNLI